MFTKTKDSTIRPAFKKTLKNIYRTPSTHILEEFGIAHGAVRVDLALINDFFHGYELKSDADNLKRLPEQMRLYGLVFDKMTLVVGSNHLVEAIHMIPDWWGIVVAKNDEMKNEVYFHTIRESEFNEAQDPLIIASLLWKDEALQLLEDLGCANGVRSKTNKKMYERMTEVLTPTILKKKVIEILNSRTNWLIDA